MSVRWVRNTKTGFVYDVPHDHWSLTDDTYEDAEAPPEEPAPPAKPAPPPPDLPAGDVLQAHGLVYLQDFDGMTLTKLERLKGIGRANARAILTAIEAARNASE